VLVDQPTREERARILDEAYAVELEMRLPISPLVRDAASWPGTSSLAVEVERGGLSGVSGVAVPTAGRHRDARYFKPVVAIPSMK
jgi:hypothetical protein